MRFVQIVKKNKLLFIVGLIYVLLFAIMPDKALKALDNSVYYIVEMVEILPVIFILTTVIEALVPKEVIIKRFGEDSGFVGNLLSLVLGSISAGPIYAAFPISKMLLSKGASVANIVIILSSWAVIKVPMLANEVKFLGFSFMGIRWILTVIAIFLMGWLMDKLVDKKALQQIDSNQTDALIEIKTDYCIGCGLCSKILPEVYELNNQKAHVKLKGITKNNMSTVLDTVKKCPTKAIIFHEDKEIS